MPIVADSVNRTYDAMRDIFADTTPDAELRIQSELIWNINRLKRERNAIILGHNYMEPAIYHGVADYVGDSLELCRRACAASASTIVFCGVRFMAETAKVLNPGKTVLLPSLDAGCSLAAGITAGDVRALRRRHPDAPAVCYINTYADVKAECDACCTSSNAAAVIESFDAPTVIFVPDEYLARNVARETRRRFVLASDNDGSAAAAHERTLVGWPVRCEVHERFSVDDVARVRRQFPDVLVLAHPECAPEVIAAADFSGSTSAMIRHVRESSAPRYLLLTECAMGDNIAAENPAKKMLRLCSVRCPHMNEIRLERVLTSLEKNEFEVDVPPDVAARARRAIERMFAA